MHATILVCTWCIIAYASQKNLFISTCNTGICDDLDLSIWIIINFPVFATNFMVGLLCLLASYIAVMGSVEMMEMGFLYHCLYFCFYVPFRIVRLLWMGPEIGTERDGKDECGG